MNGGRRRILGQPVNGRKDRDEDLLLFYEMRKREKERNISLLQPVSDEFEPYAGNFYPLYRIAYAKKGSGHEFLDKNDYDWLKTPPSTPLFPSLEMEANAPELAIQREIPISKTLSRFSGNSEASKEINWGSKPPNPKPRVSSRSVTPSARPSFSSATETRNTRGTLVSNHQPRSDLNKRSTVTTIKTTPNSPKESPSNFLYLNPSKNTGIDSNSKPRSGGVSPLVQSRLLGLSDEILPNLWTDRSSSASRGRPRNPTMTTHPKQESIKPGRKSYSPSKTRDQQIEFKQESEQHSATTKGRIEAGNGTLIFGSRMVEKVMNARKSVSGEERETKSKSKSLGSPNESSGFGRMISKSSFDMAFKHMEIKRDPIISYRHPSNAMGKNSMTSNTASSLNSTPMSNTSSLKSTRTSNSSSLKSTPRSSTQVHKRGSIQSWKKMERMKLTVKGESRSKFALC